MTSSWSSPWVFCPLGLRVPTTRNGILFTRIVWPIGSSLPKSWSAAVLPRTHTPAALETSASENHSPAARVQSRMVLYSGETPYTLVNQFWVGLTACTPCRTEAEAKRTASHSLRIAIRSPSERRDEPPHPVR